MPRGSKGRSRVSELNPEKKVGSDLNFFCDLCGEVQGDRPCALVASVESTCSCACGPGEGDSVEQDHGK